MSLPSLIENYVSDVAVTMVFGLGYYFFKSLKNMNNCGDQSKDSIEIPLLKNLSSSEEIIEFLKNGNQIQTPFAILEMMLKKGISPSIQIYNALLSNLCKFNDFHVTKELFEEIMDVTGPVSPNSETFDIILEASAINYGKKIQEIEENNIDGNEKNQKLIHEIDNAFENDLEFIVEKFRSRGIEVGIENTNIFISTLLRMKKKEKATEILRKNFSLKKDESTYEILLCDENDVLINTEEDLDKFITDFELKGKLAKTRLIEKLVKECIKFKKLKRAENLIMNHLSQKNSAISSESILGLLKFYYAKFQFEKAFEIFKTSKLSGVNLSDEIYDIVLNLCIKCRKLDKIRYVFDSLDNMDLKFKEKLIYGYKITKDYDKAFQLYENIQTNNQNEVKLNTLHEVLECCITSGKFEKMDEIYEKTLNIISPNQITYSLLIRGYCRSKNIIKIKQLYSKMRSLGFYLDEYIYKTILECFINEKETDYLEVVYQDMIKNKIRLGLDIIMMLLKLYSELNSNKGEKLFEQVVDLKEFEQEPNLYSLGIKIYLHNKNLTKAIALFRKITFIKELLLERELFLDMIHECLESNKYKEAFEFALSGFKRNYKFPIELVNKLVLRLASCERSNKQEKFDFFNRLNKESRYKNFRISDEAYSVASCYIGNHKIITESVYCKDSLYSNNQKQMKPNVSTNDKSEVKATKKSSKNKKNPFQRKDVN